MFKPKTIALFFVGLIATSLCTLSAPAAWADLGPSVDCYRDVNTRSPANQRFFCFVSDRERAHAEYGHVTALSTDDSNKDAALMIIECDMNGKVIWDRTHISWLERQFNSSKPSVVQFSAKPFEKLKRYQNSSGHFFSRIETVSGEYESQQSQAKIALFFGPGDRPELVQTTRIYNSQSFKHLYFNALRGKFE